LESNDLEIESKSLDLERNMKKSPQISEKILSKEIGMNTIITAIYEKGVLRPIEKIDLPEHSEVTIIIQNQSDRIEKSKSDNWRDAMTEKTEILVSEEELMQPLTDIWRDYI